MEKERIADGGVQYVPQIAVQYVYLDFDGELTDYNGEILTVENVEVKDSALTKERIANIVAELNAKYASQNVIFVTDRPVSVEYSTIFIGKTDAFSSYGNFAGLAETIDEGNKNSTDKAFVMLDSTDSNEAIISTISHETDHLLGTHNHGGEGLVAYAAEKEQHYAYYHYNLTYTGTISCKVDDSGNLTPEHLNLSYSEIDFKSQTISRTSDTHYYYYDSAVNVFITSSGSLAVRSNTAARNINVTSFGKLGVNSGGIAYNVNIDATGSCTYNRGVINGVIINSGGLLATGAYAGWYGEVNDISLYSGGALGEGDNSGDYRSSWIQRDGLATITQMSDGKITGTATNLNGTGSVYIGDGGIANYSVISGVAKLVIFAGGVVNDTIILARPKSETGYLYGVFVGSGGTANNTTVSSGGKIHISGTANSTTFYTNGHGSICSGGTANDTIISGGYILISSGGTANNTVLNSGAIYISSGGVANNTIISSGGSVLLRSYKQEDAIANNTIIHSGGRIGNWNQLGESTGIITQITSSGLLGTATDLNGSGSLSILSGAVASNTILSSGTIAISSGGSANDILINSGGSMYISAGATALDIKENGGYVDVISSDAQVSFTANTIEELILSSSSMTVHSNTIAEKTLISSGHMYIYSGGIADNTTLNAGGYMHVSFGGVANDSVISGRGLLIISDGGAANDTIIIGYGQTEAGYNSNYGVRVKQGGTVNNTTISSNGYMFISGGATAKNTVLSSGRMYVSNGGYASNVTVCKGTLYAGSDASLHNVKIMYGGYQNVSAGAVLTDKVILGGEMRISGTIDTTELDSFSFVLEDRNGGNSFAMLNDISLLNDIENYSISILTTQENGQYKLAGNAGKFTDDVIFVINERLIADETEPDSNLVKYQVLSRNNDADDENLPMDSPVYTEVFKLNSETGKYNICAPDRQAYVLSKNDAEELVLTVKDAFVKLYYENELLDAAASMKNVILQANEASRMEVLDKGIVTSASANNNTHIDVFNGGTVNHAYIGMDAELSLKNGAILRGKINVNGIISVDDEYGATVNANNATINIIVPGIPDTSSAYANCNNGVIKGLDNLSGSNLSITVIGDSANMICKFADNAKLFQDNISMTRVYADDSAPEDGIFKWYADFNFYSAVKTKDDCYYIINKSEKDELYLTVTAVRNFEDLKVVVPQDVTHYGIKVTIEDFNAGWGKKTNKRDWASLAVTGLTFCAIADTEKINISCHGKMEGTLGILSVTADLSRDGDGLFLTMTKDKNDNWEYSNWELVGKFDATLQRVDRRFKFDLPGTQILDTKKLTGSADINTDKGEYTLTVDWKRSQWGMFQEVKATAKFKETDNDLNLSLIAVELKDDPTRVRRDFGWHVYKLSGECGNLAKSDKDPAYFSGTIAFTWMSQVYRIKQKWVKELCQNAGIELASGGELKFSIVDTELGITMDVDNNFQADGSIRLLNVGNKSIATINGHVEYWSNTQQIFVGGTLDIAGFINMNASVDIRNDYINAKAHGSITLPGWIGWFIDCKMVEGTVLLTHSDVETVITVYGVLTDKKNYSSYVGISCNLSTGEKFRIDNQEDVDAAYDYNTGVLERGDSATEEYDADGGSCLVFQGDYTNASDNLQICITNKTTGIQYNYSLSTDKVEQNVYALSSEYGSIAPEVLVLNENGFAIAVKNEEDARWQLKVQDNGSDLENFNMYLVREDEQRCKIDKFVVSDVTSCSAKISYSISGFADNTIVELYCRQISNDGTPDIWLANLTPGTNQTFTWEQKETMQAGDYQFFLKVSGNIIPFESNASGVFSVEECENNFISAQVRPMDDGFSAKILPIFSIKYEKKEYSFDNTQWQQITDETLLDIDRETTIFLRGYDDVADEYSDVFIYKVNCNVSWDEQAVFAWTSDITDATFRIELSRENSSGCIFVETDKNSLSFLGAIPEQLTGRVQTFNSGIWTKNKSVSNLMQNQEISTLIAAEDQITDIFFANANGTWSKFYSAEHRGILNGWKGTKEQVAITGKNKIADVFKGSSDANVLVLTDDANGDALFVDDVYTSFGKDAARISQIDEIRAGIGDDIIDLTSQKFAYVGEGVKVYGGVGNDTIWANKGKNLLFGDAGNDRIVGGSDNDVIIGGIGNDSMHGGGGKDIFTFGGNWGKDTITQLTDGKVTLWFEDGSASNWNASNLTYTDGENSVKVTGIASDKISLKFGGDTSELPEGAFAEAASEKIFEDKNKGMLA